MNDSPRIDTPSVKLHKRQFAWQVLVPVIVFAAVIIAAAVLVVTRGAATDRVVADISIMWLIVPVLILSLVLMVLVGGLIYGMAMLTKIVPTYTGKFQSFLVSVQSGARKIADGTAKPFIWIDQTGAAIKAIFKKKK